MNSPPHVSHFSLPDLARLARIRLTEAEVASLSQELAKILAMVEVVRQVPLTGVAEPMAMNEALTISRKDEPGECLHRAKVLEASPQANAGYVKVPKVFE